jgi:ribosomal protein S4
MAKGRKIATSNKEKRWSEIDTLEQGSPSVNPSLINLKHREPSYQSQIGKDNICNKSTKRSRITTELLTSTLEIKSAIGRHDTDRSSPLLQQITERRKIRILYGNLSNKEINTIAQTATTMRGERSQNMFKLLESRLDVVLYRSSMFPSIMMAQQWIRRGSIVVNKRIETVASRMLTPGDVITPADNLLPPFLAKEIEVNNVGENGGGIVSQSRFVFADFSRKLSGVANRPIHIEISYRSLSMVYLCHTHKILLPATLDIPQARKAYTK